LTVTFFPCSFLQIDNFTTFQSENQDIFFEFVRFFVEKKNVFRHRIFDAFQD
jgi:hypothetical protein